MFLERERKIKTPEEFFSMHPPATDHDGVMCDLRQHVLDEVNNILGTSYVSQDVRSFHCVRDWSVMVGWSRNEAEELEEYVWYDPQFLLKAPPVLGAPELSLWLSEHDIDFPVITSRRPNLRETTGAWYKEHMPWVRPEQICMQADVEMDGGIWKAWVVNRLGVGIIFEDVPFQAKDVLSYTNALVVLLSDLNRLPVTFRNRIIRYAGKPGRVPNLVEFNREFLGI